VERARICSSVQPPPSALTNCHRRIEALPGQLSAPALGLEAFAVRIHNFEIADNVGAMALGGKAGGAARMGYRSVLRGRLVAQITNARRLFLSLPRITDNRPR